MRYVCGCDIPLSIKVKGNKLNLAHNGLGVVIHGGVQFGENCKVYQGVTIGESKSDGEGYFQYPIIGDNVRIYAGAKVLGGIKIGNNSIIGANAVVLCDVPDNCVAVGVPAKIIDKNGSK